MNIGEMKKIGTRLGVNWKAVGFTPKQLLKGYRVEKEHKDVTGGDIEKSARIALAHLKELPDYYERLEKYVEKKNPMTSEIENTPEKIKPGIKVADATEKVWDIWCKLRDYVTDEEIVDEFDNEFDACEDEEEAEELFVDVIMEYMNEEEVPDGVEFGERRGTGEMGFWKEGEVLTEGEDDEEDLEEYEPEEEKVMDILDSSGNVIAKAPCVLNPEYKDEEIKHKDGEKEES